MSNYVVKQVVKTVPRDQFPIEYGMGWLSGQFLTSFNTGDPVYWTDFENNSPIIEKEGTGSFFTQINLEGGRAYKLQGTVTLYYQANSGAYYRMWRWYNVTKGEFVGSAGGANADYAYTTVGNGSAQAFVALEEDSIFELRCSLGAGTLTGLNYGTSFIIEHYENMKI